MEPEPETGAGADAPKPVKKVLDKNNHMMRGILSIQKDRGFAPVERRAADAMGVSKAAPTTAAVSEDEQASARAEARAKKLRRETEAQARKVCQPTHTCFPGCLISCALHVVCEQHRQQPRRRPSQTGKATGATRAVAARGMTQRCRRSRVALGRSGKSS